MGIKKIEAFQTTDGGVFLRYEDAKKCEESLMVSDKTKVIEELVEEFYESLGDVVDYSGASEEDIVHFVLAYEDKILEALGGDE